MYCVTFYAGSQPIIILLIILVRGSSLLLASVFLPPTTLYPSLNVIHHYKIINTAAMYQPASGQINQADYFGMDKVTVILEWIPAEHDAVVNITVYYYIIVDPWLPTDLKSPVNPFRWNLTLSYNISYSVSVLSSICGHNNIIANMTLKYGECATYITILSWF